MRYMRPSFSDVQVRCPELPWDLAKQVVLAVYKCRGSTLSPRLFLHYVNAEKTWHLNGRSQCWGYPLPLLPSIFCSMSSSYLMFQEQCRSAAVYKALLPSCWYEVCGLWRSLWLCFRAPISCFPFLTIVHWSVVGVRIYWLTRGSPSDMKPSCPCRKTL